MEAAEIKDKSTRRSKQNDAPETILTWPKKESMSIVTALNKLLADYSVHYQKLRNYHWNVKGDNFFDLHERFEILYNEARLNIDEIAERIRVFGMTPYSTMREYLDHSDIKETETDLESAEMVEEVLNDFKTLIMIMDRVVDAAAEKSDSGTEELMKRFIRTIEKHHWMLSAFSESE